MFLKLVCHSPFKNRLGCFLKIDILVPTLTAWNQILGGTAQESAFQEALKEILVHAKALVQSFSNLFSGGILQLPHWPTVPDSVDPEEEPRTCISIKFLGDIKCFC